MAVLSTVLLAIIMMYSPVKECFGQTDTEKVFALTERCALDIAMVMEDVKMLVYQQNSEKSSCVPAESSTSKPHDCQDVKNTGHTSSGLATIFLPTQSVYSTNPVTVSCDQTTADGGWMVLLRRIDKYEDFPHRSWADYRQGFGNPTTSSFWLGLENMHRLTRERHATLRIELEDFEGEKRYAEYSYFR